MLKLGAPTQLTRLFRHHMRDGVHIVVLEVPSLDARNASRFGALLANAVSGESPMVMDLSELRFFDLPGFAAISKWAVKPTVRLCSGSARVHALLELLGADTMITLFPSQDEAIASFRSSQVLERKTPRTAIREKDFRPGRRTA